MGHVKPAKLPGVHTRLCEVALEILKGEPVLEKHADGSVTALRNEDGSLVMVYKAGCLREVRTFLKDNHIDSEAIEGEPITQVAKQLRQFDDQPDAFLLEHE